MATGYMCSSISLHFPSGYEKISVTVQKAKSCRLAAAQQRDVEYAAHSITGAGLT